jgi:hypothetical protein
MLRQPSCQDCRWFSLLRDGAVIGRCRNEAGGLAFPRREACCPQFDGERRARERDESKFEAPPAIAITGRIRRA